MKTITDHDLLIIAENWANQMPINTGITTAFAEGFKYAMKLTGNMKNEWLGANADIIINDELTEQRNIPS